MVSFNPTTQNVVSKRKLIATGATLAVGGGTIATLASRRTRAAVSLSINDDSYEGTDGSVSEVSLSVDGAYEYSSPGATTLRWTLDVAPAGQTDWATIDQLQSDASGETGAGSYSVSGSILDHPSMDSSTFSADAGETNTTDIEARVTFEVVASDGSVVVSETASGTGSVEVTNTTTATQVSLTASGQLTVSM